MKMRWRWPCAPIFHASKAILKCAAFPIRFPAVDAPAQTDAPATLLALARGRHTLFLTMSDNVVSGTVTLIAGSSQINGVPFSGNTMTLNFGNALPTFKKSQLP